MFCHARIGRPGSRPRAPPWGERNDRECMDLHRVEELGIAHVVPELRQSLRQRSRECTHAPGDAAESVRPVVHRVHTRHDRQQHLRSADVARGPVALDVLLAGLDRQSVGRRPGRVLRHAHQPPRHLADVLGFRGHVRRMRSAKSERHAESLRRTHGDVRAVLAGRPDQRQGQQIRRHHHQRPVLVRGVDDLGVVDDAAFRGRVLKQHARIFSRCEIDVRGAVDHDLDALGARP